jgi:hypothetical protein
LASLLRNLDLYKTGLSTPEALKRQAN